MPPRLSVVLAVHGEQAHLRECAASVLELGGPDVELVAVDDASPDHAPELLDVLAERDPRVRVTHLPERVGLGEARNLGLREAEGEYVWFVETTDVVTAVDRELRGDVLLVHHLRAPTLGPARPGPHRGLLARVAREGPGTLERWPRLADAAPRVWAKVFRREFLTGLGVRFGSGEHGELQVTWPALLTGRIAASPAPAYVRRRPGNAVRHGSPFDVFPACDAVLGFVVAHDVPEERRRLVRPAMTRRQLELLPQASDKPRFFHEIAERAEGQPVVQRGGYPVYRALEESRKARRALGRKRAALRRRTRRTGLQRHYRARLKEPVDPRLAVFAAYWYRGYSCNPRAIYEAARRLVPGMRGVWVVKREHAEDFPAGVEHVVAGTREYFDLLARAAYFVNNVNFPNHLVKRPGTVHVMTHHGTPLKKMGLDLRDHPVTGARMDFRALLRRCARWDYSVSQNAFSTLVWERVYPLRYESLEVGYPRNDVLATASDDDVQRAREELGVAPGQTAVLFAPTHREYLSGYVPTLDLAAAAEGLGEDHVILARLHYFYGADEQLGRLHRAGRVRDVAAHPSIETLCLAADVLVTDYSSLMFDYAVLDRPIVVHAPDWDVYRSIRGTYFDLMAEPPGAVSRSDAELVEAFGSGAVWGDDAREARAAFRARFCALDDGRAAERVVRRVWLGEREPAAHPDPAPVPHGSGFEPRDR